MRIIMRILIAFFLALTVTPFTVWADEIPYFGMSKTQYQNCRSLGKQVLAAQKAQPDSPEHKRAYKAWDESCGMKVMLDLSKKHNLNQVPVSPRDWAEMR